MIKKRWSKCIAAIGTIVVLNSLGIGAYAFQIEQQGSNLLISGTGTADENVSVTLLKNCDAAYDERFFVLDETTVGVDGTYAITVIIPDIKEGISANGDFELKVRVGDALAETCQITGYISKASRDECVNNFMTKPTSELKDLLDLAESVAVMKILGVDMDAYAALDDSDKDRVISVLETSCTRGSLTEEEIRINLNKAIYLEILANGDADKALNGINSVFEEVAFSDIADKSLSSYLISSLKGSEFDTFEEYDNDYCLYNILYLVNDANPVYMKKYLEEYADELGIKDEKVYMEYCDSKNKSDICSELVMILAKSKANSTDELIDAIDKAIKKETDEDDSVTEIGKGSGGGGGGRGSSGGYSGAATVVSKAEEIIEETIIFTDIADYEWAEEAILALNKKGIVSGNGNGQYNPSANVTREEFSKILTLAMGIQDKEATCSFSDVPDNEWYYMYVASLNRAGIINGIGNGMFGTGAGLTREDMTVMIYNAMNKTGRTLLKIRSDKFFGDRDSISGYAKEAVKKMYVAGKVNGTGDNFEPKRFCTRAEAAKIIYDAFIKGE